MAYRLQFLQAGCPTYCSIIHDGDVDVDKTFGPYTGIRGIACRKVRNKVRNYAYKLLSIIPNFVSLCQAVWFMRKHDRFIFDQ